MNEHDWQNPVYGWKTCTRCGLQRGSVYSTRKGYVYSHPRGAYFYSQETPACFPKPLPPDSEEAA